MGILFIPFSYFGWVYTDGWKEYFRAWKNFHWFFFHFFSVDVLFDTLFAPWRRLSEGKTRGFDPEKILERIIINLVLRLVGFVVRAVFILAALIVEMLVFIFGIALFIIFIFSPVALPAMFFSGILLFLL